jgi:hypothetical protein
MGCRAAYHTSHAALLSDQRRDLFEDHDGCCACLFGENGLLLGHDVHDDTAWYTSDVRRVSSEHFDPLPTAARYVPFNMEARPALTV